MQLKLKFILFLSFLYYSTFTRVPLEKGARIKENQNLVNFDDMRADGIRFVLIPAKNDNNDDFNPNFNKQYERAKEGGISVGVWWLSKAKNPSDAKNEASSLMSLLKGKQFEYPIYFLFDIWEEENKWLYHYDTAFDSAKAFCDTLRENNYLCGIYFERDGDNRLDDESKKIYSSILCYGSFNGYDDERFPTEKFDLVETGYGRVNGIYGRLSTFTYQHLCYMTDSFKDYTKIIKEQKLNGF